ncbi:MAG: DUF1566 domain-containing protein [Ferruginibacter sp.]
MKPILLMPIFLLNFSIVFSQNVGIGVSSPTSKLQVNGQIAIDQKNFGGYGGLLIKGDAPGSNYPNICFSIKNTAAIPQDVIAGYIGGNINSNTAGGEAMDLSFFTSQNGLPGLTTRLTIKDNGDVGIGTSAPGTKLEINGKTKTTNLQLTTGATNGYLLKSDASGNASWVSPAAALGISLHSIGESYGGGIVFYVYDNGQHGLIAATADQSTGIRWNNGTYITTNAVRDGIGAFSNTAHIIASQGEGNYAAMPCAKYNGGGYGDWYLPSKYELNLLYLQKAVVGGFTINFYWSSSEFDYAIAWNQFFGNGDQIGSDKEATGYVRAVRAF